MCEPHRYQLATTGSTDPVKRRGCAECKRPFTPRRAGQVYCGAGCRREADKASRRKAPPVLEPPFTLADVMRRDRHRCVACGGGIDVRLPIGDPRSAAIAHDVPIAAGGRHVLANCRAAHLEHVAAYESRSAA